MPNPGSWRKAVIRSLIAAGVAALPTLISVAYVSWVNSSERPLLGLLVKTLIWPVGTVICQGLFTSSLSSDEWRGLSKCLLAVTWAKYCLLIVIVDWLWRWRILSWLVTSHRATVVACLHPCAFAFLLEIMGGQHRLSDSIWPPIVFLLGVANALVLLGIAHLRWSGVRRLACSLPFWLAWIWWWSDLRFHLYVDISDIGVALRILVPLLGFVLYATALQTTATHPAPATPSKGPGAMA